MRSLLLLLTVPATLALAACTGSIDPTLDAIQAEVFTPSCAFSSCHDDVAPEGGLDLSSTEASYAGLLEASEGSSMARVVPGDPDNSLLYAVIVATTDVDDVGPMPPGVDLPDGEIDAIRQWIADGAAP